MSLPSGGWSMETMVASSSTSQWWCKLYTEGIKSHSPSHTTQHPCTGHQPRGPVCEPWLLPALKSSLCQPRVGSHHLCTPHTQRHKWPGKPRPGVLEIRSKEQGSLTLSNIPSTPCDLLFLVSLTSFKSGDTKGF